MLVTHSIWLQNIDLTNLSTLPMFPIPYRKGCDLSTAVGICRDQSSYSQLWIGFVFPWISLNHLFCLVCNWVQVLSQHTGPTLCPAAVPRLSPHLGITNCPGTDPVPPAGSHPSDLGTQLHLRYKPLVMILLTYLHDAPHLLFSHSLAEKLLIEALRENSISVVLWQFEGGHLPLPKAF